MMINFYCYNNFYYTLKPYHPIFRTASSTSIANAKAYAFCKKDTICQSADS